MKIQDLKRIINEELAKVLAEAPQPQIAEPDVEIDTDVKPTRRRTITPEEPIEEPAKAEKIAQKIAARFKKPKNK